MSDVDRDLFGFGMLASALGGGGDRGNSFPESDAADLGRGASWIPGEVTLARREGKNVRFVQNCHGLCCWYWEFPDGSRIYYWNRSTCEQIGRTNHGDDYSADDGDAGPCPSCGNEHTMGGTIAADT